MSSTQQYKDYNKRLKIELRCSEDLAKRQGETIKQLTSEIRRLRQTIVDTTGKLTSVKIALDKSKRWYQIILKIKS